jgi:hypothetical protein
MENRQKSNRSSRKSLLDLGETSSHSPQGPTDSGAFEEASVPMDTPLYIQDNSPQTSAEPNEQHVSNSSLENSKRFHSPSPTKEISDNKEEESNLLEDTKQESENSDNSPNEKKMQSTSQIAAQNVDHTATLSRSESSSRDSKRVSSLKDVVSVV